MVEWEDFTILTLTEIAILLFFLAHWLPNTVYTLLPFLSNIPSQFSILNFFKNTENNPSFSQFNYINSGRWRIRSWIGDFLAQKSPTNGLLKWTWMMNLWDSWTKFCWFVASRLVNDFGPCRENLSQICFLCNVAWFQFNVWQVYP